MTPLRIFASSVQAVQDPGGSALYAALVEHLERRELLRGGPFDTAPCTDASSTISIAGAVRIGRRVRDPNTARGAGRAAGRVHRPGRCAEQNEGRGHVAARVDPARVTARVAEDESARVVGRRAPCRRPSCPAPVGPEAGVRPAPRGGQPVLADRVVEYTVPDKPRSRLQKYRLTETGRAALAASEPTRAGE